MFFKFYSFYYRYFWFVELNILYFDIVIFFFNVKCMFICKFIVVIWNIKECNVLYVLINVCLIFIEIVVDWSDYVLWWLDKN